MVKITNKFDGDRAKRSAKSLGFNGQVIDPMNSPYFGTYNQHGYDKQSLGNGDGSGFYDFNAVPAGYSEIDFVNRGPGYATEQPTSEGAIDAPTAVAWLKRNGLQLMQAQTGKDGGVRYLQDADGNIVGEPQQFSNNDDQFGIAALLATAVVGGAVAAGASGGTGGAAAANGIGAAAPAEVGALSTTGTIAAPTVTGTASSAGLLPAASGIGAGEVAAGGLAAAGGAGAGGGTGTLGTIAAGSGEVGALSTTGTMAAPTVTGSASSAGLQAGAGGGGLMNTLTQGAKNMGVSDWLNAGLTAYGIANQPKAADTSGINQAAVDAQAQSRDAFEWFKGEMQRTQAQRDATAARDDQIAQASLEGMQFATQEAKDLAARRKTVFDPVENKLVADATGFDTPGRRAQAVAEATADVEGATSRALQANNRAMMRTGATLDGPAAAALAQDGALAKAKMVAGATGSATRGIEQQGWARMSDAASLGKGTVGNQATQQQIATSAGGAGVNAGAGSTQAATSSVPIMQAGYGTSNQALQTAGSLFGQAGQIQNTTRGQELNFMGNVFGSYMRSSKKVKSNTGNVTDGKAEQAEVMATPVHAGWKYDPNKGGPDDGGQPHTGPMAEDVRAKMGDNVAPGGEMIDMKAMGGKLMAAVQAVTRDVAELRDQMAARARMNKKPTTKEA